MNMKIGFLVLICRLATGSVIGSDVIPPAVNAAGNTPAETSGWTAEDMPDPRYCPECCGITESGWICDPDGVFAGRTYGGGPQAADLLNNELWAAANKSVCPCPSGDCSTWDVVIFVAVVKKLKNPDGKSSKDLINAFAKELQEEWWKADDTECQQEIIVALSLEDEAITTEIGDDILNSKMMSYDDVVLVGGISQALHASYDLFAHITFLINTYGLYVDHPPETTTTLAPSTTTSIQNITGAMVQGADNSTGLPPSVIAVIVISAIVFIAIVVVTLVIVINLITNSDKSCLKFKR